MHNALYHDGSLFSQGRKLYSANLKQLFGTPMKLLIRNLSRSTTESQLRALFQPFGEIQSCTLVMDKETGESKGFGFVEMPKFGPAKIAMKSLNNQEVDGSRIRVKYAQTDVATEAEAVTSTTGKQRRD
ncbi:hypothetical protein [Corallincola luteus]